MFLEILIVSQLLSVGENTGSHFCQAPTVVKGKRASITCFFSEDPSESGRDVHIQKYKEGNKDDYDIVLSCLFGTDGYKCQTMDGYSFKERPSKELTLVIPNATDDHIGEYLCQLVPALSDEHTLCKLTVIAADEQQPTPTTREEDEDVKKKSTSSSTDFPAADKRQPTPKTAEEDEDGTRKASTPGFTGLYGVFLGFLFAQILCLSPFVIFECRTRISNLRKQKSPATPRPPIRQDAESGFTGFLSVTLHLILSAVCQITIGTFLVVKLFSYEGLLQGKYKAESVYSVAVGIVIFLVGFLVFYQAVKSKKIKRTAYVSMLAASFVVVVLSGIAAFTLHVGIYDKLTEILSDAQESYGAVDGLTSLWDMLQREYECCGVKNPEEWNKVSNLKGKYPLSCCKDEYVKDCTSKSSEIKTKGCADTFVNWIQEGVAVLGALEVAAAIIPIVVLFLCKFCFPWRPTDESRSDTESLSETTTLTSNEQDNNET